MQRENFIFTIGYKDDQAIVDKRQKNRFQKLDTLELYKAGLLKPAVASAIYAKAQGDESAMTGLISAMNADLHGQFSEESLRKIFGITGDPSEIGKVLAV